MRQSEGVEITCAYHVLETVKCAENKMTRLLVKCESRGGGVLKMACSSLKSSFMVIGMVPQRGRLLTGHESEVPKKG